jgi:predicted alpha/beta-fold hydrolase
MDEQVGEVRLTGRISTSRSRTLVLLVHGLGGSAESAYLLRMARTVAAVGWSTLRLNLRGADLKGEDYYHAGLTSDLLSVLASSEVSAHDEVFVVGFSLGGHVCLKLAAAPLPASVRAVVSVSAPLDLAASAHFFDEEASWLYRRHVLSSLATMLARVAERRETPVSAREAARIRSIRDWDERVVAPRHGFSSAADYYAKVSAGNTLEQITVPTLILHARHDPMVPPEAVESALRSAPPSVTAIVWSRGGHLGFPAGLDLGNGGSPGLEHQITSWLARHARGLAPAPAP